MPLPTERNRTEAVAGPSVGMGGLVMLAVVVVVVVAMAEVAAAAAAVCAEGELESGARRGAVGGL